ncbi:hypothetical protein QQF64_015670 [Cirrhinus molitorella]|uniref:Integrase catalytic domain-containing protein n=1 Tax=Cirrhinus molitorella TaxID=172907 RepID=A0ABR3NVL1_9TELE
MRLGTSQQGTILLQLLLPVPVNLEAARGKTSHSGTSSHSRTSRRSVTSTGVYLPPELSSVQTAVLEEKIKQRQFDSLRQQVEEDSLADMEYQRLQTQAKEAQRIQEEALAAKEALSKHLERQRKLQQAATELEVAKLVSSMVTKDSGSTTPVPSSASPLPPALSPQSPLSSQQPFAQLPTVTSFIKLPSAEKIALDDKSQLSLRSLALTLPTTESVGVPVTPVHQFPPAVPLPVSTVPPTSPITAPPCTVISATYVTPQHSAVTTVTSAAAHSMSLNVPSVPQQPMTATIPTTTYPYMMQQSFIPPVSRYMQQQQHPVSSQQASAIPPNVSFSHPPSYLHLPSTHTMQTSYPGTELLFASAYGIPQPKLPVFESGNESDFALLKLALDNLLSNHSHLSEQYKYHVLLSHLRLPNAHQLAKAYMYHPHPYSAALQALQDKYGQPRQLVQSELGAIMNSPPLRLGDANAFDSFALSVQSLVGMLRTLEGQNGFELMCGSHVDRLLSKLPPAYRDSFVEYCLSKGILQSGTDKTYTLPDLAAWLDIKSQAKRISSRAAALFLSDSPKSYSKPMTSTRPKERSTQVLLTSEKATKGPDAAALKSSSKPSPDRTVLIVTSPDQWPSMPKIDREPDSSELKKSAFIGIISVPNNSLPDPSQFHTWQELIQATVRSLHGAASTNTDSPPEASEYIKAEKLLLAQSQMDSFPAEVRALKAGHNVPQNSRLGSLAPEYDDAVGLIRVGGRLRRASDLELDAIHPIVLDPKHCITKLLIKETDQRLLHPGSERVLAELRRQYWILRAREAVRRHQYTCRDCQLWRAKPQTPRLADLPPCRLNLYKPPFYSTGIDCFGPFAVKIGRRQEKRWGIIYKCLTTRCVHLDLLEHMDSDAFLLSLRRFIARRGKPMELLCDNGTNFVGGHRELQESFEAMSPKLQEQLAEQSIRFLHNPPNAPHFGGTWEREIKSVKAALHVILREQSVPEPVLQTLLIEVESILNSKPLGYVSSDVADVDPVTPNLLLMGRRDASLPQVLYDSNNLLGKRRWRHSQVLADCFWTAFIRRYLPNMQGRQKWRTDGRELTVGQVVLVIDPQLPRSLWPVGTVTETLPGADGRVRIARVKVNDKNIHSPSCATNPPSTSQG